MFDNLRPRAPDPLLDTIRRYRADPRPHKLNLGVGVFQDESGRTQVLRTVKAAERILLETQETKSYLGAEGDVEFTRAVGELALGTMAADPRFVGMQTPGGTGALRLGAELIRAANPDAHVWLGRPAWSNHVPIFSAAGLTMRDYRHYDPAAGSVCMNELLAAMCGARHGDVFVLQASCHNPTGADFSMDQWREIARALAERNLVPLIDAAYQGFAHNLDDDMAGARYLLDRVSEALVTVSCSKNFGLYRERTGALFVKTEDAAGAEIAGANLAAIARSNYSMPPDHGAAVVRTILHNDRLRSEWEAEAGEMQVKLRAVRDKLARLRIGDIDLSPLARQNGLFAMLPLEKSQVARLRDEYAIYLAPSGRINIAGLLKADMEAFAAALQAVAIDAA